MQVLTNVKRGKEFPGQIRLAKSRLNNTTRFSRCRVWPNNDGDVLWEQESRLPAPASPFADHQLRARALPPFPPAPCVLLWGRDLAGETLAALLITGELTGWGGEMYIFSCSEEKGDQETQFSVRTFLNSCSQTQKASKVLNLRSFRMGEREQEKVTGGAGGRGGR